MPTKSSFRLRGRNRDSYLALVRAFPLASITSEAHLDKAQEVIDQLLRAGLLDKGQEMYLYALSDLVVVYEDDHCPIAPASDSDMLRYLMHERNITQAQLSRETAIARSTISEALAGKRRFTRRVIRKLAEHFKVSPALFL